MGLAFRFRAVVFALLYLAGLLAPWDRMLHATSGTLWLALATLPGRSGWLSLENATRVVTSAALMSLAAGALLRVSGTAWLGAGTMRRGQLRRGQLRGSELGDYKLVAGGPYRYLRNPLYLGTWFQALGASVLMPTAGASFFLPALTAFVLLLIFIEEHFLSETGGAAYEQYRRQVPRIIPRLTAAGGTASRPNWTAALLAEVYPVSFTLCFAGLAWRYNSQLLIRCLFVCYGMSLVIRAFLKEPASPAL
jgi:protein-S-isoprenylcysteine O-methyltransferase Ste14